MDFTPVAFVIATFMFIVIIYLLCHLRQRGLQRRLSDGRVSVRRLFAENGRRLSEFGQRIERNFGPFQFNQRDIGTEVRRRSTLDSIHESNDEGNDELKRTNIISESIKIDTTDDAIDSQVNRMSESIIETAVTKAICACSNGQESITAKFPFAEIGDIPRTFSTQHAEISELGEIETGNEQTETKVNSVGEHQSKCIKRVGFKLIVQQPEDEHDGLDGIQEKQTILKINKNNLSVPRGIKRSYTQDIRRNSVMPILPDPKCLPRRKSVLPLLNEEKCLPYRRGSVLPKCSSSFLAQPRIKQVTVRPPVYVCPRKTSVIFNSDIFAHSPRRKSSAELPIEDIPELKGKETNDKRLFPHKSFVARALRSSWSSIKESTHLWQNDVRQSSRRTSCTGAHYTHRRRSSSVTRMDNYCQKDTILDKIPGLRKLVLSGGEKIKEIIEKACKSDESVLPYFQPISLYSRRQSTHIPKTKGNYLTGNMMEYKSAFGPQAHDVLTSKCLKHGPLYEISALGQRMVFLFDHKDIDSLKKAEGKYPKHMDFKHLRIYRQRNNLPLGVLLSNGEEWKQQRQILSKVLVSSVASTRYIPVINQVAKDAISMIRERHSFGGVYVPEKDAGNYAIEAFGRVLYGRELQCLCDSNGDTDLHKFVKIAKKNFEDANVLMALPSCLMLLHPAWRRHNERWNFLLETTIKQVKLTLGQEEYGNIPYCVLSQLRKNGEMTEPEMLVNLTDLLLASIDTTSSVLRWCLYELSLQPHIQTKIVEDFQQFGHVPDDVTFDILQNMTYLKAVIKETLRLHPVGFFASRTTAKPMSVRHYTVPQKANVSTCMYVMGRDKSFIQNPEVFQPDRWLMGDTQLDYFYKDVPFGFGPRMCLGRRVAEIEMALFILHFCMAFEFKLNPSCHVEHELKLLLVPSRKVELILKNRA